MKKKGICHLGRDSKCFKELLDKSIISIFLVWADQGYCAYENNPFCDIQLFDSLQ